MLARSLVLCLSVLVVTAAPARRSCPSPVSPRRATCPTRTRCRTRAPSKVLFMVGAGPKPEEVNPTLMAVARYVNTLAKAGVPPTSARSSS